MKTCFVILGPHGAIVNARGTTIRDLTVTTHINTTTTIPTTRADQPGLPTTLGLPLPPATNGGKRSAQSTQMRSKC